MIVRRTVLFLALALLAVTAGAAESVLGVLPAAHYDEKVPALAATAGFAWGEDITDPEQVVAFARSLAQAVPSRVRLVEYGRSLEGRPLVLLVISAEKNIARLNDILSDLDRLADPRKISEAQAKSLIPSVPAVVWLACSVHGDEASGGDAGLALAYALAAGHSEDLDRILESEIVIIDPAQNPDGRARFVASTRQARGPQPDLEPNGAEHVQPWPGGRFSHDLFDLNRDWFALTSPETAGRVAAMLHWHPTVVVDLHEMGAEMGYYFAPPAQPFNPDLMPEQVALWELVGRANAAAFDARGWRFWTREEFDAFYPGYGESWPYFSGALGMTYEQASARGRAVRLEDGAMLTYADAVKHHLVTSFDTCEVVSRNRERFVRSWADYRRAAVAAGDKGDTRAYILEPGTDPAGAWALADLLARQGVEVLRAGAGSKLAAGSFVVPLDQPLGRLARELLEKQIPMGREFEKRQEELDRRRQRDEIYDITAWSLPLLWSVPVRAVGSMPDRGSLAPVVAGETAAGQVVGDGDVAYLMPWSGPCAAQALARLLRDGATVDVAGKALTVGGRHFERGAVIVRKAANPAGLRARLEAIARETGAEFVGVASSYADSGIDLGSTSVHRIKPPRIAVAWDVPTSPMSAGDLRWAVERFFGYPVSPVRTSSLAHADLSHFDVIVLPDGGGRGGSFAASLGEEGVKRLACWVKEGGVLVAVGGAATFLTSEKVELLASAAEKRGTETVQEKAGGDDKSASAAGKTPFDYEKAITPRDEDPPAVPGAILRVDLDAEDILAAGFPSGSLDVLVNSHRILTPLSLDKGTNVGIYAEAEHLVQSGFVLRASREQLPRKAYMLEQKSGRGMVVAFAEDPAARGLTHSSMVLLANALFFAPAF